jgi:hypothetical protein
VVEDDHLLDTRDLVSEHVLDLLVVAFHHSLFIGEELLLGRVVVDMEPRVISSEFMFPTAQVVDFSAVVLVLEVVACESCVSTSTTAGNP